MRLRHGSYVERVAAERGHRADVRAELGIDDGEFVVVTAANFREQKQQPNLLRAAWLLADRKVAVAIGPPIVAIDVGGMAEEVQHEADALLVPPGDSAVRASECRSGWGDVALAVLDVAAFSGVSDEGPDQFEMSSSEIRLPKHEVRGVHAGVAGHDGVQVSAASGGFEHLRGA